ncbi:S8 family serine peptidase [Mycobacterium sp.]|uniref:S8 family serine peptidase n=1 Tax=Mycobacterium sp. TaxID=1785 RepID=UPI003A8C1ECB
MKPPALQRICAFVTVCIALALLNGQSVALAVPPPSVDPGRVPQDATPAPEQPMRQSNMCARTIAVAEPDITATAPGFAMLNVASAWKYSTGNGVAVAIIDTGVTPGPRLKVVPGGDYIMAGDGLQDCDAHGTIVASVIGAAPQGTPMPAPMPPRPAFAPPPAASAPPPPTTSQPDTESASGTGNPAVTPDDVPAVPGPGAGAPDGVVGVAPHAVLISIRQSSRAYETVNPYPGDSEVRRKAGSIATLARAIVHAANLGAKVINISVTSCVPAADPLDQAAIGAAVWYAATVKDAVIVAAAGNDSEDGCVQNPQFDPLDTSDPRDWHQVKTVSSPSWFSDYVLSVGAVDNTGAPLARSLSGPWVAVAAPGAGTMGLSAQTGAPVNAYAAIRPGEKNMPIWGTSFSAAYVSGVAALVRAKFPELSAHQIVNRILQTAHNPPRGVDNQVGYGVVDPVAALTFDVPAGDRLAPAARSRILTPAAAPPPPDHRARTVALVFAAVVAGAIAAAALVARAGRRP